MQAGAQVLQDAALVIVLYVDPAIQDGQPVLAVTEHKVDLYVPAAHTVQAVHDAEFVVMLYVDPATQAVHPLFTVTVQTVDT